MKKLNYILLLFLVIFTSCDNATEIIQDGEANDAKIFTSTANMKLFLEETYDKLYAGGGNAIGSVGASNTANEIALSAILTDEVGVGRGGSATAMYRMDVATNNSYSDVIWLDHYTVINYCNRLIRGSALVTPIDATDALLYNHILAQARALRAYSHLQLLVYFSTDMKNNSALGIVKMDRVPTLQEQFTRNTNGECFALIESDLNYAASNISSTPATGTKPWAYVTLPMINSLRARMYAYRGNYTLAETYADLVIATPGLTLTDGTLYTTSTAFYGTTSNNLYKRMFQDQIQGEVIWSIGKAIGKTTIGSVFNVNLSATSGVTLFDMNRNLFNILDNGGAPWDIRRRVNIDPTAVVESAYLTTGTYQFSDNLCIDKYSGITGAALINDIKVFRLSEILLIKAEARVAAGDNPGAATIIKQIRDKRSTTGARPLPSYATATDAWADILLERRVELCFEGHRYIDLKRLGALANKTIDRHPLDCSTYFLSTCSFPVTDYRFTLPIPLREIAGNPQIQQNPNY